MSPSSSSGSSILWIKISPLSQKRPAIVTLCEVSASGLLATEAVYSALYILGLALSAIPPSTAKYFFPLGTCFELPIVYNVTPAVEIMLLPGSINSVG